VQQPAITTMPVRSCVKPFVYLNEQKSSAHWNWNVCAQLSVPVMKLLPMVTL